MDSTVTASALAWMLAGLATKVLMYLGAAVSVGGVAVLMLIVGQRGRVDLAAARVVTGVGVVGVLAVITGFFVQVGSFADAGLAGMADGFFIQMLWQSALGDASVLRVAAILLAVGMMWLVRATSSTPLRQVCNAAILAVALMLGYSFSLVGHSANLGASAQLAIVLHIAAVLWWVGGLYPLWRDCRNTPSDVFTVMHTFGRQAAVVVAAVVVAGAVLVVQLIGSPAELLTTAYGALLLVKLLLVTTLLLMAARHKWQLVPDLQSAVNCDRLRRSIAVESFVAFAILIITAFFTTFTGPAIFEQ